MRTETLSAERVREILSEVVREDGPAVELDLCNDFYMTRINPLKAAVGLLKDILAEIGGPDARETQDHWYDRNERARLVVESIKEHVEVLGKSLDLFDVDAVALERRREG